MSGQTKAAAPVSIFFSRCWTEKVTRALIQPGSLFAFGEWFVVLQ